jgi:hypothetical protein
MNIVYRISSLNFKDYLLGIYIIIIYFSTPHSLIIQLFPIIYLYSALGIGLIIVCLTNNKNYRLTNFDKFYSATLLLIAANSFGEILRWDIHRFFGWITLIIIIILIWGSKKGLVYFILDKYIFLISIISLISVVVALLFIFKVFSFTEFLSNFIHPRHEDHQLLGGNLSIGGILFLENLSKAFINYDTTQMVNFGTGDIRMPRLTGHLQQASLISAYFLLPLGIRLMIKKTNWYFVFVILSFCIFSQSGTAYFYLLSTATVFIFYKYFKKWGFILPILFSIIMFIFAYMMLTYIGRVSGAFDEHNSFILRVSSGLARLIIMANQIEHYGLSPIIGHVFSDKDINLFMLGSFIFGNGVRSGILGLLLSLYIYYLLIKRILNYNANTKQKKLGVALVYPGIIMMMSYQDFGFSSTTGFISLSLLMYFLKNEGIKVSYFKKRPFNFNACTPDIISNS